ncbi:hypothetical protein [Qipengyuania gaetbuli]|uniref:hypothetical protein n=1 Tax=Qipengyuania gaetbuli TaxID=266952 RepID=UPI001CD7E43B|nr:hypothetical protein [Qipengyuania gaetbuli]MCA0911245.1 hypothetical protein [Qipengyuania gaetbuli]
MTRLFWHVFRIAYGGFFAVIGAWGSVALFRGQGNPFLSGEGPGPDFQAAMEATGFLVPTMLGLFVVGGLALSIERTAPLGVILLAPFVTVIFFYHLLLGGSAIWGFGWAIGLVILAWRYRSGFGGLVNYGRA